MPYGTIAADRITGTNGNSISPESSVFRNRIINGAMVIDQRNAGANTTVTSSRNHYIDRFSVFSQAGSKLSIQQNAGSVTPPTGFTNYAGLVCTSAVTLGSGDQYMFEQQIEGYNVADLDFGKSTAKTITLSFWVRSSLTGTFAGVIANSSEDRTYPFTYTINSANTWEYETITIPGDTSGTWLTTNGVGLRLKLNLGTGTTYRGTAGAWTSSAYISSVTGTVNFVETVGATWQITGVQLEAGSTATSYDYRHHSVELAMCQRYYQTSYDIGQTPGTNVGVGIQHSWATSASGAIAGGATAFSSTMRTIPSVTIYDRVGNSGKVTIFNAGAGATENTSYNSVDYNTRWLWCRVYAVAAYGMTFNYTASAEL
jgi:hypothetical protein